MPERSRVVTHSLLPSFGTSASGQSLIEVALFLPLMVLCAAYAVDFGYFFIVSANLTSSTRNAAEYSIQGYESPGQTTLPVAGPSSATISVSALALADLAGLANSATQATVQVCSKSVGTTGKVTNCSSFGPAVSTSTATAPQTDPEAPTFLLNRVDVTYTVEPPIPLSFFSVSLLPKMSFHRFVSMRVMD
jgi:Flp pilus assembly protein TadG